MVESPDGAIVPVYGLGANDTVVYRSTLRISFFIFLLRLPLPVFAMPPETRTLPDIFRAPGSNSTDPD